MCGCGRKSNQVVTSVQAAQTEAERRLAADAALLQMEQDAVREAETWAQSAANAVGNSSS